MTQPDDERVIGDERLADDRLVPDVRDPEAPEADAFAQAFPINAVDDRPHRGLEVNEADAIDQSLVVHLEDDYR